MKILVAVDGSEHAWKALDLAVSLAKGSGAELFAIHVVPYEPLPEGLREFARVENVPIEEENARYHYDKTLGDAVTRTAETRAREQWVAGLTAWIAEGRPAGRGHHRGSPGEVKELRSDLRDLKEALADTFAPRSREV